MKPDAVTWKDEGEFGPVHIRRDGELTNYKDSKLVFLGRKVAEWFSRTEAVGIAKKEGLPFEEG